MSVLVLLTCLFSSGCCCRENERLSKLSVAWGKQKSVVGGFHGEVAELGLFMCVNQVGTLFFRLVWPTGREPVGNGTSSMMVGIGQDAAESYWLPTESAKFKSQASN